MRGIMLVFNRSTINADNDDDHYEALVARQLKAGKKFGTIRDYNSIPIGSTVAVQWEERKLWTPGTVIDKDDYSHSDFSNRLKVMKTEWLTIRNSKNMKATPIMNQLYL